MAELLKISVGVAGNERICGTVGGSFDFGRNRRPRGHQRRGRIVAVSIRNEGDGGASRIGSPRDEL